MILRQPVFDTDENDVEIDWLVTARVVCRYFFLAAAIGLFVALLVAMIV